MTNSGHISLSPSSAELKLVIMGCQQKRQARSVICPSLS